jgi:hypothetical protein
MGWPIHIAHPESSDPLTRIIHEASTAAADLGMPTALRSVGLPAGMRQMRLVFNAHLRRLATNLYE